MGRYFLQIPGAFLLLTLVATSALGQGRTLTIVALGDSILSGYGLPTSQGYVPQLERWLRSRGHDVRVINAGVAGDTAAATRRRADRALPKGTDGVIIGVGGNDMLRGTPVKSVRRDIGAILSLAGKRGIEPMLVGYKSPGNKGMDYKRKFDSIYPDLAKKHHAVLAPTYLSGLKDLPGPLRLMACCMQSDRMHPNARGVELMVQATGRKVERLIRRIKKRK